MRERQAEIDRRLGMVRIGAGPALRLLAAATADEPLVAVVGGMWERRGWFAAATPTALHLARKPRLGRARQHRFAWEDLREAHTGVARIELAFADGTRVALGFVAPNEELEALGALLRDRLGHERPDTTVEELRGLARRKLGRLGASSFDMAYEPLIDRLQPGERVERLALAELQFHGLLVLTDRRLLLYRGALRRAHDELWELPRAAILDAAVEADGTLALTTASSAGVEVVRLTAVSPPERAEELAVVLMARGTEEP